MADPAGDPGPDRNHGSAAAWLPCPHRDHARTRKVLDELEVAIAMADGETHALAEPEQLATDVDHGAQELSTVATE